MPTILAAIDFSDVSASVIENALRQSRGGTTLLLHVAPADPDYVSYRVGPDDERDEIAHRLRERRSMLHREIERLEPDAGDGSVVETLLVQGDPAERIAEEAVRRRADLIVIGRHGHGALHDRLFGSVAETVLRSVACPVLVVPCADASGLMTDP